MSPRCACGVAEGDRHARACPYPLYGGSPMDHYRWNLARLASLPALPGSEAAKRLAARLQAAGW